MSAADNSSEWLRFAQMDYDLACHAFHNMHPKPLELICYHCHQALEKALKAILIQNGEDPPKTHDLRMLCKRCMEYEESIAELAPTCNLLTSYGVQPKYPHDMEITEDDTALALRRADTALSFCNDLIQTPKEAPPCP